MQVRGRPVLLFSALAVAALGTGFLVWPLPKVTPPTLPYSTVVVLGAAQYAERKRYIGRDDHAGCDRLAVGVPPRIAGSRLDRVAGRMPEIQRFPEPPLFPFVPGNQVQLEGGAGGDDFREFRSPAF